MATLHFDCFSGISGDMTLGALVDLGLPLSDLTRALKGLALEGYRLQPGKVRRAGLPSAWTGTVHGLPCESWLRCDPVCAWHSSGAGPRGGSPLGRHSGVQR